MPTITEQIVDAHARIHRAAEQFGRDQNDVKLLAVSKTKPASMVIEAHKAGLKDFGENYVQEGVEKIQTLSELDITWHFIGPLQSNKTRQVAEHFDWVHSIDRLKIAERLNQQRPDTLPSLNVCIQVNISAEASKSGTTSDELTELADAIANMPKLKLRGLMAIPAPAHSFDEQRAVCGEMKKLFEQLRRQHTGIDTLSMGMSGDLEAAIAEGSTMVRIGTAIFGARL